MHPELKRLAMQTFGAFTLEQARGFYTDNEIRARVSSRRWCRLGHGVYAPSALSGVPQVRGAAAFLMYGDRVALSHYDAAHLHGFGVLSSRRTHLTAAAGDDICGCKGFSIHTSVLVDEEIFVGPFRVTSASRTVVDLLKCNRQRAALSVADAALRAGLSSGLLFAELERHGGMRGIVSAREVARWADARAESPPESEVRAIILGSDLPPPDLQIVIYDKWGRELFRIDLGWEDYKVGIEYDGEQFHRFDERTFLNDREKHNHMNGLGWQLFRFTKRHLHQGRSAILGPLRSALISRGWRAG